MGFRGFSVAAVMLVVPLASCAMTTTTTCVDFHSFETPAAAGKDAGLVVVGTVVGSAGQRPFFQESAPVHRFAVESVIKGELPEGVEEIDVASVPQTCNGEERGPFPDGDPLATDKRIEVFIHVEDGKYRTLTPWDGVEPAPAGEALPWDPTAPER